MGVGQVIIYLFILIEKGFLNREACNYHSLIAMILGVCLHLYLSLAQIGLWKCRQDIPYVVTGAL